MRRPSLPQLPDPYAAMCVLGTMPLVVAPEDPCGVRFARLGHDAPEDCLTDPALLPEGACLVHLFLDRTTRDVFVSALQDYAGNAVRWTVPDPVGPPLALVVRFDEPRPLGVVTVSDAVTLVEHGFRRGRAGMRADMAEARQHVLRTFARERDEATMRARWASEIVALAEVTGVSSRATFVTTAARCVSRSRCWMT